MFGGGQTGLAAYVPETITSCLDWLSDANMQLVAIGVVISIPVIFGLSYVLDMLGEACGNKANAEGCGTVQRYLFSALTAIMAVLSLPITLLVVILSLAIAAVIAVGYILSLPLSMLRRILIIFLRKISPMSIQDKLEVYTGKLLCADQGGCPSGVVQVEGQSGGASGGSGGKGGRHEECDDGSGAAGDNGAYEEEEEEEC